MASSTMPEVKTIHLRDYYLIILKHRWLILGCFLGTLAAALGALAWMVPTYEAKARLSIESSQQVSPITGQNIDYEDFFSQNLRFKTHFELVTSRPVLERVLDELSLAESGGEQVSSPPGGIRQNLLRLLGITSSPASAEEQHSNNLGQLRRKIKVSRVMDTKLMEISVMDRDPLLARNIANTLARVYIQFDIGGKQQATESSFNQLKEQSLEHKKKLEAAEQEFLQFKQRKNLFSIEGKQQFIAQKITEFNNLVVENRYKLQEITAKLAALGNVAGSKLDYSKLNQILVDNPVIGNLNQQHIDAQLELSKLRKVYQEKHPKVTQVLGRIEDIRREIDSQVNKELANMRGQKDILTAKEKTLQKNIDDLEGEAMAINSQDLDYKVLQRNVDTYREQYDAIMAKLKQSDIISEVKTQATIRLVEEAATPLAPAKPDKKKFILGGIFLGLFGGIALAFLLDYLDQSLRTEEDVNRYLQLPVLAVVPLADGAGATYGYGGSKRQAGKPANPAQPQPSERS